MSSSGEAWATRRKNPWEACLVNSILFVAAPSIANRRAFADRFREAGLLPVTVPDGESALRLLRQFTVVATVVCMLAPNREESDQYASLIATGTPVVLIGSPAAREAIQRHLPAGCAAFVAEPFTSTDFRGVMQRVRRGERGIIELSGRHAAT